jgi:hypothetical protein
MRTVLVSALALGALTSAALAGEPVLLTDAQMDAVSAGQGVEGGDALAISAAVIFVGGNVNNSTLIAISGDAAATGGDATATTGRQMVRASGSSTLVLAIPIDRIWQNITEHVRPGEITTFKAGHTLLRFSAPSIQPTTRRT